MRPVTLDPLSEAPMNGLQPLDSGALAQVKGGGPHVRVFDGLASQVG